MPVASAASVNPSLAIARLRSSLVRRLGRVSVSRDANQPSATDPSESALTGELLKQLSSR
jgi:hypothetical protein